MEDAPLYTVTREYSGAVPPVPRFPGPLYPAGGGRLHPQWNNPTTHRQGHYTPHALQQQSPDRAAHTSRYHEALAIENPTTARGCT